MISYLLCLIHVLSISLGLTGHPPKRQRSDSSESYDKVKRQNVQVNEPLQALAIPGQREASQATTCTFEAQAILQSSNARPVESPGSSWDPSQQASQVNKSDYFDDSGLDQYLDELNESTDRTIFQFRACQKGGTDIIEPEDSDEDAITELLDEAS